MDHPHPAATTIPEGIGASISRVEDDRHLRGMGEFIADLRLPGMQNLAFVRSPLGHARIRGVRKPAGAEDQVFTAADLLGRRPDRRQLHPAGLQALRPARFGDGPGAPCRRGHRRLRRPHPRRGGGPGRAGRAGAGGTARGVRHAGRARAGCLAAAPALGRQRVPGNPGGPRPGRGARRRPHHRPPHAPHRPAAHGAHRGPRPGGALGPAHGPARAAQQHADAARRPHRPGRVPRPA